MAEKFTGISGDMGADVYWITGTAPSLLPPDFRTGGRVEPQVDTAIRNVGGRAAVFAELSDPIRDSTLGRFD